MDETGGMDRLEPRQELGADLAGLLQFERPALPQHLEQRLAVDVLHRHQLAPVDLDQIEDPADVGRDDLAGRAHLSAQHLEQLFAAAERDMERLERHVHPQLEVVGPPDFSHASAAEELENPVAVGENLPRLQGQPARLAVACGWTRRPGRGGRRRRRTGLQEGLLGVCGQRLLGRQGAAIG